MMENSISSPPPLATQSSVIRVKHWHKGTLFAFVGVRLFLLNYACFCLIGIFRAMLDNQNPTAGGKGLPPHLVLNNAT